MTAHCTSTADAITGVLLAGDVVLNLAQRPLNTVAGTRFIDQADGTLRVTDCPVTVHWQSDFGAMLASLLDGEYSRIVVVSEPDCDRASEIVQELETQALPCIHCVLADDCEADAFMDEADSEAVAERLRQLGYI